MLAHGVGHDQDVREQDRAIEAEALDRLERHLHRSGTVVDEIEKPALLGSQSAVFGQIAPRLPHEPYGRSGRAFAGESVEQETGHRASPIQKNKYYK